MTTSETHTTANIVILDLNETHTQDMIQTTKSHHLCTTIHFSQLQQLHKHRIVSYTCFSAPLLTLDTLPSIQTLIDLRYFFFLFPSRWRAVSCCFFFFAVLLKISFIFLNGRLFLIFLPNFMVCKFNFDLIYVIGWSFVPYFFVLTLCGAHFSFVHIYVNVWCVRYLLFFAFFRSKFFTAFVC